MGNTFATFLGEIARDNSLCPSKNRGWRDKALNVTKGENLRRVNVSIKFSLCVKKENNTWEKKKIGDIVV